ncbi:T9SS C-terminal target domain-containing protein, partial [candidate division KSB1 bacterium]
VRRVERRSIAGEILAYAQSTNGQWPSGANTANPTGGAAPIVLTDGDVPLSSMDVTERISAEQPLNHDILNAYPNPFNASTTIVYNVTQAQHVTLRVFDLAGREVALLKNGFMPVGRYQRAFNGTDLPSGIYFARLSGEISTQIQKLVLLK